MPEPILAAEGIVRTYAGANGVLAVRGASLALKPKDFVALMGPSGSGKTTFIGVLSGLDRPDAGAVRWKGAQMSALSAEERRALRRIEMGVVFQSFGLLPTLSAVENVELPLRFDGTSLDEARTRATDWLTRLGLGDRLENRTFELSAGQQQRVAVARALIAEPEVVLADEPIAEVDTENADLILEALWDVIRRGGAVWPPPTTRRRSLRQSRGVVPRRADRSRRHARRARDAAHHRLVRSRREPASPSSEAERLQTSSPLSRSASPSIRRRRGMTTEEPVEQRPLPVCSARRSGHHVSSCLPDPTLQVQVARRMADHGVGSAHASIIPHPGPIDAGPRPDPPGRRGPGAPAA
jgi:putative ABC transport system ATP-binding protein